MPKITLEVTSQKVGYSWLFNYQSAKLHKKDPQNRDKSVYLVPTYLMNLKVDGEVVCTYEVIRFGIVNHTTNNGTDYGSVCGIDVTKKPEYLIDNWNGKRTLASYQPAEKGAWHVAYDRGTYLVHSGPNHPQSLNPLYGASGCIEVCGPGQWKALNDRILKESGKATLEQVAADHILWISYQPADYPGLFAAERTKQAEDEILKAFLGEYFGGKKPEKFTSICSLPTPEPPRGPFAGAAGAGSAVRTDPLILDLNGDGIRTVEPESTVYSIVAVVLSIGTPRVDCHWQVREQASVAGGTIDGNICASPRIELVSERVIPRSSYQPPSNTSLHPPVRLLLAGISQAHYPPSCFT